MDIVAPGDLAELVRHAGAAGDTGDQATGLFEHALKHALRATHFPQHVDVDRALAARDVIGAPDLFDRTVDRVLDQFLMRSEEHTSELQSLMRISYAVFCLKKKKKQHKQRPHNTVLCIRLTTHTKHH